MPFSIGMDAILCPVQNCDLQTINYRRLRKLFYKVTCNPSHHVQSLSHIQSTASFPACIPIQYTENLPCFKNRKESKWIDIWERRNVLAAVTHHRVTLERKETLGTLGGTQETRVQFHALKQHLYFSMKITLFLSPPFTIKECFVRITTIKM